MKERQRREEGGDIITGKGRQWLGTEREVRSEEVSRGLYLMGVMVIRQLRIIIIFH